MILRNVGWLFEDYTVLYPRRYSYEFFLLHVAASVTVPLGEWLSVSSTESCRVWYLGLEVLHLIKFKFMHLISVELVTVLCLWRSSWKICGK
jgi:hypothetical protein